MKSLAMVLFFFLFVQSAFAGAFEELVHAHSKDANYVQTEEDKKRVGLFSAMFDLAQKQQAPKGEIPRVLHLIWLGPNSFPQESLQAVSHWVDQHPAWTVKFWTDMERPLPDARMQVHLLEDFPLGDLKNLYYQCDNFGERSLLLRYAILLEQGGVCFEHDSVCIKALDALQSQYDFFCGMEPLAPSILSSSVNPSPHLIGTVPRHPILRSTKMWLKKEWERLERDYPGQDSAAIYNRVQRRSFRALGVGIRQEHNRNGRKDAVFPPHFFSQSNPATAEYATHSHLGTWYKKRSEAEIKMQRLLTEAGQEAKHTFLLTLLLTLINVFAGIFFLYQILRKRRAA